MNVADSAAIGEHLRSRGGVATDLAQQADLVIVNTCSVRGQAEHKALSYLGRLALIKVKQPAMKVVFAGSMAERVKESIKKRFPFINLVVGARDIEYFPQLLDKFLGDMLDDRSVLSAATPQLTSFINIMRGCENHCSYCIVPTVRGPEKSRAVDDILADIRRMAAAGTKEVTLLGQNVNSYTSAGRGKTIIDFSDLLQMVNGIDGIDRIRFMTNHPKDFNDKLIETMSSCAKVCDHIHLPLQSGSDTILAAMNRKYTAGDYLTLANKLKHAIPRLAITTDIMVGFPGETDADFAATLRIIEHTDFDFLYAFKYSPRPGTPAAAGEDSVIRSKKEERLAILLEQADSIAARKNAKLIGTHQEVLVEEVTANGIAGGRTRANKKIFFAGESNLRGTLVSITVTGSKAYSLEGSFTSCV